MASEEEDHSNAPLPQASGTDIAWKHGTKGTLINQVICNYCKKSYRGGINRLKYHLARLPGNDVALCNAAPPEVTQEMQALIATYTNKKIEKTKTKTAVGGGIGGNMGFEESVSNSFLGQNPNSQSNENSSLPTPSSMGPMDGFFVPRTGAQPSLDTTKWGKEKIRAARAAAANFWYYCNIPFNVASSPYWEAMVNAFINVGRGMKAPTAKDFSGPLLEDAVVTTRALLDEQRKNWRKHGCTIMSDGWTDTKNRTLLNFMVASSGSMVFLKSIDASDKVKDATLLFQLLEEVVLEVGVENVVQVVTDNASAYVSAGKMLERKYKTLFWSPCAAHVIDLMLEDMGKLAWIKRVVEEAKIITKFIYNHTWVLSLMREHTGGKEIIRPGITRFASNFLALQSLFEAEAPLKRMFISDKWRGSSFRHSNDGEKVQKIVFDDLFWKGVDEVLKVTQPWVKVLRLVDGDLLPMGYLYEAMDRANGAVLRMYARNRNKLDPLESIINRRWTHQLHRPLHATGYYFNPKFFYDDNFEADDEVMDGLYTCIDRMILDDNLKGLCPDEIQTYKRANGRVLSSVICKMSRRTLRPDLWWEDNGARCPNLQRMAVRILSQPCSASGCERNWSMFESIHTKRCNRLSQQRLNDLVFVQYNLRLHVRQVEGTDCYDAIDLDSMDPLVEWVAEDEEPIFTDEGIERLEREAAVEAEGTSRAHDGAGTSRAAAAVYMEDEDEDDDEDEYIPEPEYPIRDEDVPVPLPSPPHVVRSEPMTYKRARGKRPLH